MSSYDDRRRYREPREARYVETQEYRGPSQELVPRSTRVEADMPVEPYQYDQDIRRARSAGPYYEDDYYGGSRHGDSRDYERGYDGYRSKKGSSKSHMEEERARRRMLSKEQKIMAALAGAALFAGGKELYDRREAKEEHAAIHRNPLASAALGAAGALAGYQGAEVYSKHGKSKSKHVVRGRDGRIEEEYWTGESSDDDRDKKHNNSFLKNAIAAAGLGKALKSMTGGGDDQSERSYRSRSTRRSSHSSSRSHSESAVEKIQKAAVASLLAGASEAFRVSKQPGSWKGEKTKRILTAAVSGGGINAAHDTDHHKLGLLESVLGGLGATRVVHGSKKDIEMDEDTGRSRSRSRVRSGSRARSSSRGGHGGGAAGPLAAVMGAIAGKKLLDRSRSRSRGRRDDSIDSYDSKRSKKGGLRERSRSAVRKLMGKTTLDDEDDRYDDRRYDDDYHEDAPPRRSRRHRDYDSRSTSRSRSVSSYRDRPRGGGGYESESDLGNSDDDDKQYKKIRGKSIISASLAGVATIHAAHGVYQSYEKRQKRLKAVKEGTLSEAEAKRLRKKALLQDAASVGIAALGVKGAISEVKDAKSLNDECKEFKHNRDCRHQKRLEKQQRIRRRDWEPSYHDDDSDYYLDSESGYHRSVSSARRLPAAAPDGRSGYRSG
ncbi:hypothetical protein MKZ38_006349 [Zalerion maritima]|uniref:DUF3824 domain-containing protein n=1 Tax=Zalerion maritima TaxID=339359 RepID=A0AAD5RXH6_9PEZI|nr:hypothetical protein MKZ38_006349 [Zalerion maritima]